jgi:hypothetical protein
VLALAALLHGLTLDSLQAIATACRAIHFAHIGAKTPHVKSRIAKHGTQLFYGAFGPH